MYYLINVPIYKFPRKTTNYRFAELLIFTRGIIFDTVYPTYRRDTCRYLGTMKKEKKNTPKPKGVDAVESGVSAMVAEGVVRRPRSSFVAWPVSFLLVN